MGVRIRLAVLDMTALITKANLYTLINNSTFNIWYFLSPLPVNAVKSDVQYKVIGYTIRK